MTTDTEILVAGAGPAGLTTAIGLARAGVDVLVIDRHAGTSPFPKSTGVSTRTMELLRTWGLEDPVRAGALHLRPLITTSDVLVGPETGSSPTGYPTDERALAVSPSTPCYCPQDHLEPVLLEHLLARGGRVRFGTELTGLATDPDGACAELLDRRSGRRSRLRARYVVGADGPHGLVRAALGIGLDQLGTLGDYVGVTFRAELTGRMPRTPSAINLVETPDAAGLLVPVGADDRWIYGHEPRPGPEDYRDTLRRATGLPDLRPELISVHRFTMGAHVARALRSVCGRGFLVGDAAHRTTPEGGIGMNTAMHAAHNLGWKLAWALRGHAGEPLLDSYQAERLPVGAANAARSLRGRIEDGLALDLAVGYRSAVVTADTGVRAPHAWVRHGGRRVSTLDLFDGRLTVFAGYDGGAWRGAAQVLAVTDRLPIAGLTVGRDVHPVDQAFAERYRLGPAGAVLVRPDGFIAWRHDGPAHETAALRAAVDRALGRRAAAHNPGPAAAELDPAC